MRVFRRIYKVFRGTIKALERNLRLFLEDRKKYWHELVLLITPSRYPLHLKRDLKWRGKILQEITLVDRPRREKIDKQIFRYYSKKLAKAYFYCDRRRAIREVLYESVNLLFTFLVG